jgi:hypothetical protein
MHDLDAESIENHPEADGPVSVERNFLEDGSLTSCRPTKIFEKLKKKPYPTKRLIYYWGCEGGATFRLMFHLTLSIISHG